MAKKWVAPDFGGPEVLKQIEVELPAPKPGEVTIEVRAAGMNPTDYKGFAPNPTRDRSVLPLSLGYEVAGIITAIGPDTRIASGGGKVGDEVLAFRISGGYATAVTVPAKDVFAKPEKLSFAEAANLLLVGATAAQMLDAAHLKEGDTVVVHGASGAVGVSLLQQLRLIGVRVIGTSSEKHFSTVKEFGATPIKYGPGLKERIQEAAPDGIEAALDTVGTDEAIDVSLALLPDRQRIVSVAAFGRAQKDGFQVLSGGTPASMEFRDKIRAHLVDLAAQGKLTVPVAKTFPFDEVKDALELLKSQHPGGKLALVPNE